MLDNPFDIAHETAMKIVTFRQLRDKKGLAKWGHWAAVSY